VVLVALLRSSPFSVHLHRGRIGGDSWYFRFSPKALLEVTDDGVWSWRQGSARWRRELAPYLADAGRLLAALRCGRVPASGGVGLYAPPPATREVQNAALRPSGDDPSRK
jgi:hypothetical protein